MTILKRAWKATEVDREGATGLFNGLGGFLSTLGIIVLPIFVIACIVLAVVSLF
ncbi:hypothetical protein [Achromobacter sp. 2789STDY5608628]|uniref:hypothetical protein n=1 Tax=Achromobacter sp. 2789STDY5608628 TaxID=1806493 RepID=UPI0006C15811|nr:hypothetical protein [Achromobacter sp. 2789STDY5608628]CUJ67083.1 Uncharacterised protein [Achromobacter sp. 2789STDY5608628]